MYPSLFKIASDSLYYRGLVTRLLEKLSVRIKVFQAHWCIKFCFLIRSLTV
jgi:hypothetical protein